MRRQPIALGLAGVVVAGMAWSAQPTGCSDASCSAPIAALQAQLAADQTQLTALRGQLATAQADTSTLKLYMAYWFAWTGTTHTDGWNLDDMKASPAQRDTLIGLDAQVEAEAAKFAAVDAAAAASAAVPASLDPAPNPAPASVDPASPPQQ